MYICDTNDKSFTMNDLLHFQGARRGLRTDRFTCRPHSSENSPYHGRASGHNHGNDKT